MSNKLRINGAVFLLAGLICLSSCSPNAEGDSWSVRNLLPSLRAQAVELKLSTFAFDAKTPALIQRAPSAIRLYEELPARFRMVVRAEEFSRARARITIVNERGRQIFRWTPKKGAVSKSITGGSGRVFEVTLAAEGPSDGIVVWEELCIQTPSRPEAPISVTKEQGHDFSSTRPDIFLYVVDALRADHLGCYGYLRDTSPRIDRFARENALYLNAYAQTSWTRPSAASILSGLPPKTHQTIGRDDRLPDEIITLAERLQESGYETIGVIANGHLHPVYGFAQGFRIYKYLGLVSSARVHFEVENILLPRIRRKDRKPLFVLIWTIDPHDPYEPEPEDAELFSIGDFEPLKTPEANLLAMIRSGRIHPTDSQQGYLEARYDQEIRGNDRAFGKLLDFLVSEGTADETAIVFTSDHGEEFFEHGGVGHGRSLYNEQVHVPLIIKAPSIPPGHHASRVQHIDLYPTILEIAGLGPAEGLEGRSLTEGGEESRTLYFELMLDGYDLTAVLGDRKVIYARTKREDRSFVPLFEIFENDDVAELHPRQPVTFRDRLLQQQIFNYRNNQDSPYRRAETKENSVPPEIREHLKALGYIR